MNDLHTERLLLRAFRFPQDADDAFAIYGDPEVMRWLGTGEHPPDPDAGHTARALERAAARVAELGERYGLWAVQEVATGRVIGAMFVVPLDGGPEVEIAYQFARAHWGKGFATEASRAVLAEALRHHDRIVGVAYAANEASLNVLRKIGMTYEGPEEHFGKTLERFSISR